MAMTADLVFLLIIAAGIGVAAVRGALASRQPRVECHDDERRFLCPHCLQFGAFENACGACRNVIMVFLADAGAYTGFCSHCNRTLWFEDGAEGQKVLAYCSRCHKAATREIYHNRHVRVVGVLNQADFDIVAPAGNRHREQTYSVMDDGKRLTYILNIERFPDVEMPLSHAINALQAVWFNTGSQDPLELGLHLDRLVRRADWSGNLRGVVTVCLTQNSMDPTSKSRLDAVFRSVALGVSAEDFLGDLVVVTASATGGRHAL
jgi:hypothetical protein